MPSATQELYGWQEAALHEALAGLANLQRVYLECRDSAEVVPLPLGRWLRSLRWLGLNVNLLASSIDALQAATGLEFAAILDCDESVQAVSQPAAIALFQWLAGHPPLCRVTFGEYSFRTELFAAPSFAYRLAQLRDHRPGLLVRLPGGWSKTMHALMQLE